MKILVSWSGGKDSQACLIEAAKKYGAANITAVFCDTGWEHPVTYQHVQDVCSFMGVELVILRSAYTFVSLAKYKKRFPSTKARFCTEELKVKPMIDYVLSLNDSCLIIQGIRSGESTARAAMDVECMYFKYYFEPIETNSTRLVKFENQLSKAKSNTQRSKLETKKRKVKARLEKGKEDPKYYTYRKKDVFAFCKKYDASVCRPIKDNTAQEVIDIILNAGQKPNPLYYRGYSRVGCFPCMMCKLSEIRLIGRNEPEMRNRLIVAEIEVDSSFFPPSYIPKRFCKSKKYPMVQEVLDYVVDNQVDMFEPEGGYACMSLFHGLCE
jgi:3'-phosphoadenosine 5'-phosphosulfate sulfotransferase (PAPS reductase)/FAD synthetase